MGRNKLYSVMGSACLAGYLWLAFSLVFTPIHTSVGICLFKNITGIPCLSCGATRAVGLLLHGDIAASVYMNPIGIVVSACMLALPVWLLSDYVRNTDTLFRFYKRSETFIRKPLVAIVLIMLVVANWAWGISKGL